MQANIRSDINNSLVSRFADDLLMHLGFRGNVDNQRAFDQGVAGQPTTVG
jgi:hypothetical protein